MLEEKNIYWTYRNGHHEWQSKNSWIFLVITFQKKCTQKHAPSEGSEQKYKYGFMLKIGKEENPKIAASKIASTLIAIALTPDRSLDIFFNGKLKQLIFVLDCQHLINSFSYKVLDEKYANLTTIKNLIFDLFSPHGHCIPIRY